MKKIILITATVALISLVAYKSFLLSEPESSDILNDDGSAKKVSTATPTTTSSPALVRITDAAKLYSVEIPKDWKITHEGTRGVQQSFVKAESSDWSAVSDENSEGPYSPVYYKTGALLQLFASTQRETVPDHGTQLIESKYITIGGIPATYHSFTEPSLKEGIILDAHVTYGGSYYTFRFAYSPTTYSQGEEVFRQILRSIKFTQ